MLSRPARNLTKAFNVSKPLRQYATTSIEKREGDISDTFVSLSTKENKALPDRYIDIKRNLIAGHEDAVERSWQRLLGRLKEEIPMIANVGSSIVPEINFKDLDNPSEHFSKELRKRGVAVIRGVVPEQEALQMKQDLKDYIAKNPSTKAFPQASPQVYELYWSMSQMRARADPNMIRTQKFLMNYWHSKDPNAKISTSHPIAYADRLRIRQPGDKQFALGPHVDGGSVERWEPHGYGLGNVYEKIFQGKWEEYDAWESSCRLPVVNNNYNGLGGCSVFRMFQGWLSLSHTGPGEGTLLVNPLLGMATAYYMLRPFFTPTQSSEAPGLEFLESSNWKLNRNPDAYIQGATPGYAQELNSFLHPHLNLDRSMVHIPRVNPGDYVAWHCDTVHAVDNIHNGVSDSSVLYIPACPLTELNARYLETQRTTFLAGTPGPDYPGGDGEKNHDGRPTVDEVSALGLEGAKAFGLEPWASDEPGLLPGEKEVMDRSNKYLGFYD